MGHLININQISLSGAINQNSAVKAISYGGYISVHVYISMYKMHAAVTISD